MARRIPMNLHQPVHLASSPPRLRLASPLAHFASSSPLHLPASPPPRLSTFPRPLLLTSSRPLLLASSPPGLVASSHLPLSSHLLSPPHLPPSLPPRLLACSRPRLLSCWPPRLPSFPPSLLPFSPSPLLLASSNFASTLTRTSISTLIPPPPFTSTLLFLPCPLVPPPTYWLPDCTRAAYIHTCTHASGERHAAAWNGQRPPHTRQRQRRSDRCSRSSADRATVCTVPGERARFGTGSEYHVDQHGLAALPL